jgi:hypothetical protein
VQVHGGRKASRRNNMCLKQHKNIINDISDRTRCQKDGRLKLKKKERKKVEMKYYGMPG